MDRQCVVGKCGFFKWNRRELAVIWWKTARNCVFLAINGVKWDKSAPKNPQKANLTLNFGVRGWPCFCLDGRAEPKKPGYAYFP